MHTPDVLAFVCGNLSIQNVSDYRFSEDDGRGARHVIVRKARCMASPELCVHLTRLNVALGNVG